ncbi:crossover junction endonuclease [Physcia stellaris]|nr:crossover junction endonuclease [Physcia stellaris]
MATAAECANPLLAQFLKEWWDIAKERNSKGATTYKRAYESMIACPLTFTHPSEASVLHGLGATLCERLTNELKKHCERNGLPLPKKSRKRQSLEGLEAPLQDTSPPKKPRKSKPYVPKLRTGAYAILMALSALDEDSDPRLTKQEICLLAQEHCEASFTASEPGKFYTAWNSMKTLEDKDLVYAKGRPQRKYQLTEEGWEVARRIRNVGSAISQAGPGDASSRERELPSQVQAKAKVPKAPRSKVRTLQSLTDFLDLEDDFDGLDSLSVPKPPPIHDAPHPSSSIGTGEAGQRLGGAPVDKFGTYNPRKERQKGIGREIVDLSSSPESTPKPAKALWSFEEGFAENTSNNKASAAPTRKISARVPEPAKALWSYEEGFAENTSRKEARKAPASHPLPPALNPAKASWSFDEGLTDKHPRKASNKATLSKSSTLAQEPEEALWSYKDGFTENTSRSKASVAPRVPAPNLSVTAGPIRPSNDTNVFNSKADNAAANNSLEIRDNSRSSKEPFPTFQPITLQPGTFTIQLLLDSREVRAKDDRDYIARELTKKGLNPITRALDLGDFFWVARTNDPTLLTRYGEEGCEIALDYIVERKRLDDLIASVKDRRFHEQKFRLRRSGVKHVVYLIEDISLSAEHKARYHDMVQTAIGETQVLDGYFVKRTLKLDDSIRYLARMTRLLQSLYENKPLLVIPTRHLDARTYLPFVTHLRATQPGTSYNVTYPAFKSLASKSDTTTLRDVYLKMLMCTRGLSGEKAIEVQKCWGTPRALIEALEGEGGGVVGGEAGEECCCEEAGGEGAWC